MALTLELEGVGGVTGDARPLIQVGTDIEDQATREAVDGISSAIGRSRIGRWTERIRLIDDPSTATSNNGYVYEDSDAINYFWTSSLQTHNTTSYVDVNNTTHGDDTEKTFSALNPTDTYELVVHHTLHCLNGANSNGKIQIDVNGATTLVNHQDNGTRFLAIACRESDRHFGVPTRVWFWNGSAYAHYQDLMTTGATGLCHFTADGRDFLAVANYLTGNNIVSSVNRSTVAVYEITAYGFIPHRSYTCHGAYDVKPVTLTTGVEALAIAEGLQGNSTIGSVRETNSSVRYFSPLRSPVVDTSDLAGPRIGGRSMMLFSSFSTVAANSTAASVGNTRWRKQSIRRPIIGTGKT